MRTDVGTHARGAVIVRPVDQINTDGSLPKGRSSRHSFTGLRFGSRHSRPPRVVVGSPQLELQSCSALSDRNRGLHARLTGHNQDLADKFIPINTDMQVGSFGSWP